MSIQSGVFSTLKAESGSIVAYTLEHAYDNGSGGWIPKVPPGTYQCARGMHCLSNGAPFETFEIMGVTGHNGLLFHCGNFDADSEGCVLLGEATAILDARYMLTNSKEAFVSFMNDQQGVDEFTLTVVPENLC
jgi:hypothetical protein